ncbi:hypothetical protein M0813_28283 [Anaeramoeba flamelloides]|uniref:Uncharacterized protein n=1 Tax=Anaeramoeba flamelloides TaxID=1746091 RepID=A0ABQ8XTS5_9EUKA|nr:hypothetical protein M0813_28283 [Anaeramoeba flamelloides]
MSYYNEAQQKRKENKRKEKKLPQKKQIFNNSLYQDPIQTLIKKEYQAKKKFSSSTKHLSKSKSNSSSTCLNSLEKPPNNKNRNKNKKKKKVLAKRMSREGKMDFPHQSDIQSSTFSSTCTQTSSESKSSRESISPEESSSESTTMSSFMEKKETRKRMGIKNKSVNKNNKGKYPNPSTDSGLNSNSYKTKKRKPITKKKKKKKVRSNNDNVPSKPNGYSTGFGAHGHSKTYFQNLTLAKYKEYRVKEIKKKVDQMIKGNINRENNTKTLIREQKKTSLSQRKKQSQGSNDLEICFLIESHPKVEEVIQNTSNFLLEMLENGLYKNEGYINYGTLRSGKFDLNKNKTQTKAVGANNNLQGTNPNITDQKKETTKSFKTSVRTGYKRIGKVLFSYVYYGKDIIKKEGFTENKIQFRHNLRNLNFQNTDLPNNLEKSKYFKKAIRHVFKQKWKSKYRILIQFTHDFNLSFKSTKLRQLIKRLYKNNFYYLISANNKIEEKVFKVFKELYSFSKSKQFLVYHINNRPSTIKFFLIYSIQFLFQNEKSPNNNNKKQIPDANTRVANLTGIKNLDKQIESLDKELKSLMKDRKYKYSLPILERMKKLNKWDKRPLTLIPLLTWTMKLHKMFDYNKIKSSISNDFKFIEIQGTKIGKGYLNYQKWKKQIFDKNFNVKKTNKYGQRNVLNYKNEIHIKETPEFPLIGYAVSRFYQLLIGHGAPYCEIFKFKFQTYQNIALLSETIKGENFYEILKKKDKDQNKIKCPFNKAKLQELIICSMIVNQKDGKPENIICVQNRKDKKYELVRVANDHGFELNYVIKNHHGKKKINVKDILFCLNEMNEPILQKVKNKFTDIPIFKVLNIWAEDIANEENEIKKFFTDKEIKLGCERVSKSSVNKTERSFLQLLLQIDFIKTIPQKLKIIQSILGKNSKKNKITLQQLYQRLDPDSAKFYSKLRKNKHNLSPLERFLEIEKYEDLDDINNNHATNGTDQKLLGSKSKGNKDYKPSTKHKNNNKIIINEKLLKKILETEMNKDVEKEEENDDEDDSVSGDGDSDSSSGISSGSDNSGSGSDSGSGSKSTSGSTSTSTSGSGSDNSSGSDSDSSSGISSGSDNSGISSGSDNSGSSSGSSSDSGSSSSNSSSSDSSSGSKSTSGSTSTSGSGSDSSSGSGSDNSSSSSNSSSSDSSGSSSDSSGSSSDSSSDSSSGSKSTSTSGSGSSSNSDNDSGRNSEEGKGFKKEENELGSREDESQGGELKKKNNNLLKSENQSKYKVKGKKKKKNDKRVKNKYNTKKKKKKKKKKKIKNKIKTRIKIKKKKNKKKNMFNKLPRSIESHWHEQEQGELVTLKQTYSIKQYHDNDGEDIYEKKNLNFQISKKPFYKDLMHEYYYLIDCDKGFLMTAKKSLDETKNRRDLFEYYKKNFICCKYSKEFNSKNPGNLINVLQGSNLDYVKNNRTVRYYIEPFININEYEIMSIKKLYQNNNKNHLLIQKSKRFLEFVKKKSKHIVYIVFTKYYNSQYVSSFNFLNKRQFKKSYFDEIFKNTNLKKVKRNKKGNKRRVKTDNIIQQNQLTLPICSHPQCTNIIEPDTDLNLCEFCQLLKKKLNIYN